MGDKSTSAPAPAPPPANETTTRGSPPPGNGGSTGGPSPTEPKGTAAPPGTPSAGGFRHPYPPDSRDLVVVEVLWPRGIRTRGATYTKGATLTRERGEVKRVNTQARRVFRVLKTVRYHNGPADQAEDQEPIEGPLKIS